MKNEKDCVSKSERRLRNFALIRRDESQAVSSDYTLGKHGFTGLRVSEKSGRESQFFFHQPLIQASLSIAIANKTNSCC